MILGLIRRCGIVHEFGVDSFGTLWRWDSGKSGRWWDLRFALEVASKLAITFLEQSTF